MAFANSRKLVKLMRFSDGGHNERHEQEKCLFSDFRQGSEFRVREQTVMVLFSFSSNPPSTSLTRKRLNNVVPSAARTCTSIPPSTTVKVAPYCVLKWKHRNESRSVMVKCVGSTGLGVKAVTSWLRRMRVGGSCRFLIAVSSRVFMSWVAE